MFGPALPPELAFAAEALPRRQAALNKSGAMTLFGFIKPKAAPGAEPIGGSDVNAGHSHRLTSGGKADPCPKKYCESLPINRYPPEVDFRRK